MESYKMQLLCIFTSVNMSNILENWLFVYEKTCFNLSHNMWFPPMLCGKFTLVDSDEPVQPPFKLRNSKWCLVSSLTVIEYSRDQHRLWSDCTYVLADPRPCWSHIQHYWKSHVAAHLSFCHIWKPALLYTNNRCGDQTVHMHSLISMCTVWSAPLLFDVRKI